MNKRFQDVDGVVHVKLPSRTYHAMVCELTDTLSISARVEPAGQRFRAYDTPVTCLVCVAREEQVRQCMESFYGT